ncbi:MAG: hypothetical protein AABW68_02425 [archaeon]
MSSHSPVVHSPPKKAIIFLLEGVLLLDRKDTDPPASVMSWLSALRRYVKKNPGLETFLVTGHSVEHCRSLMEGTGLSSFFSEDRIWAVDEDYLSSRDPEDRSRYEEQCRADPYHRDDYFRQVKLMEWMEKGGVSPDQVVLVGHDYWSDGFYTRRFSKVDIAFVEGCLSSRGEPPSEKISGLWYVSRKFSDLKKIMEGKAPVPNYGPLDAFINITLSEQLFGGKGVPSLKLIVNPRKKDGELGDVVHLGE